MLLLSRQGSRYLRSALTMQYLTQQSNICCRQLRKLTLQELDELRTHHLNLDAGLWCQPDGAAKNLQHQHLS